jgi:hypothetical protein
MIRDRNNCFFSSRSSSPPSTPSVPDLQNEIKDLKSQLYDHHKEIKKLKQTVENNENVQKRLKSLMIDYQNKIQKLTADIINKDQLREQINNEMCNLNIQYKEKLRLIEEQKNLINLIKDRVYIDRTANKYIAYLIKRYEELSTNIKLFANKINNCQEANVYIIIADSNSKTLTSITTATTTTTINDDDDNKQHLNQNQNQHLKQFIFELPRHSDIPSWLNHIRLFNSNPDGDLKNAEVLTDPNYITISYDIACKQHLVVEKERSSSFDNSESTTINTNANIIQWYYRSDHKNINSWSKYDSFSSNMLEDAFNSDIRKINIEYEKFTYDIDLIKMLQKNQETEKIRMIKRTLETAEGVTIVDPYYSKSIKNDKIVSVPNLFADDGQVNKIISEVDLNEDYQIFRYLNISPQTNDWNHIVHLFNQKWNSMNINSPCKVVKIERYINPNLWSLYRSHCLSMISSNVINRSDIINLDSDGKSNDLTTVKCQELLLFHGTGEIDPRIIAKEGLDMRLASSTYKQFYGKAIYLSETPSYCHTHNFAYKTNGITTPTDTTSNDNDINDNKNNDNVTKVITLPLSNTANDDHYTVLLVRTLLGDCYDYEYDRDHNLVRPPHGFNSVCGMIPNSKHNIKNVKKFNNNINDNINPSKIYAIYNNNQCIVEAAITYRLL